MKPRILIVDDEPHMLRLAELSLKKGDFEISKATNGALAIEQIRLERPDLIVMDIQMPEMDGLQALAAIKGSPATANIPVIMLSARGYLFNSDDIKSAGAAAFLAKPYSPTELLSEVRRLLGIPE